MTQERPLPEAGATAILVEASASPFAFPRWFCHPRVVIDEEVHHVTWGTHAFPVNPGSHIVEVFFWYLIWGKSGRVMIGVTVAEGETKHLRYSAPFDLRDEATIEGGDVEFR